MHKLLSAFPLACYLPAALMLCAAASTWPNAAITVKKHFNSTAAQLRSRDLARIDYLYSQQANDNVDTSRKRQSQTILSAGANSHYTASIGVGNPPTFYSLIVDTGSGNTWVGSTRAYVQTNTSINTGVDVEVPYFYYRGNGNNELFGTEYLDQVTIAPGVTIINQSIGVGLPSWEGDDFVGVDGVLGLGPVDLTIDTLETDNSEVSTVMDNAFSQGLVSQNVIGISLEPIDVNGHFNGEITFGGVDPSRFVGSINWVPIETNFDLYYGYTQTIKYGAGPNSVVIQSGPARADTGTTLLWLGSNEFAAYGQAIGATLSTDTHLGLFQITAAQYQILQSLFFTINGVTYEFPPSAQIWPPTLNTAIGGRPDMIYLAVSNMPTPGGCIAGQVFLERFYSAWDNTNRRVGFANTPWTLS